jgi:hypothetical protein
MIRTYLALYRATKNPLDLVKVVSCTNVFCSTDVPAAAE